ncbi:hypothetical protein D1007_18950 [Hordeum vulgare]|uniref:uncharacterized protein LOC123412541 n=1 Tax=Hordeum vulgare subsp. vulgare TaxID=112509 RepID=UPI001D1A53DE|nr:uncharacterized protein LOC123412541 [Hordeum vulgare subsp. vulgare]KAE8804935.1 hypothetical protein D1007_18950 [Hordeum vulgare]
MGSSTTRLLLAVALAVLLTSTCHVADAARPAPAADQARLLDGDVVQAVTLADKARQTVELLMARLPAGPSPKGPGH